jgi:serine/threonine-protein kinase
MTGSPTPRATRFGRYEVQLPLGEGAVGRVLVGRDPVLGRQVALKALRDDLGDAELGEALRVRLAERVRQGARSAAALSHPGLAAVHDLGEAETERGATPAGPYVVFEFVKGPTLRERLASGPIAPSEVAAVGRTLGAALTHAHAAGVVYGDVKAENILFTGAIDPVAKLTEPGFAWLAWSDPELRAHAGWAESTAPAHGAPELLAGSRASAFSDQFGFAAALYEALTGKRPFGDGQAEERAARVATGAREPLTVARPQLRSFPRVDAIFDRALARDPRKRFSSCEVFGSVLATELEGFEVGRMSASSVSSIVPRSTRRWQNAAAGLAVVVILSLVVLGRQPRSGGEGASLTAVASAFSATLASSPRGAPSVSAAPRPHAPRATAAASAASAASVASAPTDTAAASVADAASASSAPPEP